MGWSVDKFGNGLTIYNNKIYSSGVVNTSYRTSSISEKDILMKNYTDILPQVQDLITTEEEHLMWALFRIALRNRAREKKFFGDYYKPLIICNKLKQFWYEEQCVIDSWPYDDWAIIINNPQLTIYRLSQKPDLIDWEHDRRNRVYHVFISNTYYITEPVNVQLIKW